MRKIGCSEKPCRPSHERAEGKRERKDDDDDDPSHQSLSRFETGPNRGFSGLFSP